MEGMGAGRAHLGRHRCSLKVVSGCKGMEANDKENKALIKQDGIEESEGAGPYDHTLQ